MNILLEGVDRSGKSTLTGKLFQYYDEVRQPSNEYLYKSTKVYHFGVPKGNSFDEQCDMLFNTLIPREEDLTIDPVNIFDRYIHADLIYGPLYRNRLDVTMNKLLYLEMYLSMLNTVVINTSIPLKINYNKIIEEGEGLVNYQQLVTLSNGISTLLSKDSILPVLTFDYTKDKEQDLITALENIQQVQANTISHTDYIFNWCLPRTSSEPDYIFLYDRKLRSDRVDNHYLPYSEVEKIMNHIIIQNYKHSKFMIVPSDILEDPHTNGVSVFLNNTFKDAKKIIRIK